MDFSNILRNFQGFIGRYTNFKLIIGANTFCNNLLCFLLPHSFGLQTSQQPFFSGRLFLQQVSVKTAVILRMSIKFVNVA